MDFWRLPGVWIAVVGALFMLFNAIRSLSKPVSFATYLGLPLASVQDAGMVRVYGLRALFTAVTLAALLTLRDVAALGSVALAAVVMPVGDAYLTARAGAPKSTVARHGVIAVVLLVAAVLLLKT